MYASGYHDQHSMPDKQGAKMRVGSIVKFKGNPDSNTPGFRPNNNGVGVLVRHCGTSALESCPDLYWSEVLWDDSTTTKCFKQDLIETIA